MPHGYSIKHRKREVAYRFHKGKHRPKFLEGPIPFQAKQVCATFSRPVQRLAIDLAFQQTRRPRFSPSQDKHGNHGLFLPRIRINNTAACDELNRGRSIVESWQDSCSQFGSLSILVLLWRSTEKIARHKAAAHFFHERKLILAAVIIL